MRRVLLTIATAGAMMLPAWSDLGACGDKFLVVGRGVRYQHIQASPHPASVLIYSNPSSTHESAVKDMKLQTALALAGHTATEVSDAAEFDKALQSGKYDIVLADLSEASLIGEKIRSAPGKPVYLPVVYSTSKEELAAVRSEYRCLVKAPARSGYFLAAIDEAMEVRKTTIAGKKP